MAKSHWVQVERSSMEAWGALTAKKPRASQLLMTLITQMDTSNAVVVSQKTLAKFMGCSVDTVQRAVRELELGRWVQIVKLHGPGTVAAYVINDRVAWATSRDKLRTSKFSATVVADIEDQDAETLEGPMRRLPSILAGEQQLPTGEGLPPPSEPPLPGMEPALPGIAAGERDAPEDAVNIGAVSDRILKRLS